MRTLIFLFFFAASSLSLSAQESRQYYQLKVYSFDTDEQMATTDAYLKDAFIPAVKKLDIGPVGVFKPRPTDSITPKQTYVLIPFNSLVKFGLYEDAIMKDEKHLTGGKAYLTAAHDNAPYQRIETMLMKAFTEMPQMATPNLNGPLKDRVYELRSYEGATEDLYRKKWICSMPAEK
ncbi:hypothetical protein [Maribacter halichondriae]|uniref:hypothetical protein n=1 Tax=Maribacter halichondriae TaxID=2980554 RepID=UPI00235A14A2|nr:hypothetical protein [Maribacter sp. Hal144]